MAQKTEKTKPVARICKRSATEYGVSLTEKGVTVEFTAFCPIPERSGTGNEWQASIQAIRTARRSDDLHGFFESHEMLGILRYDLQDWCRENLPVDLEEYEGAMSPEALHRLLSF